MLAVDAAFLAATASSYGYDRDEPHFRVLAAHPAWGYVDQAPLTPMMARLGIARFGDNLAAPRIPVMVCALAAAALTAVMARELGEGRGVGPFQQAAGWPVAARVARQPAHRRAPGTAAQPLAVGAGCSWH